MQKSEEQIHLGFWKSRTKIAHVKVEIKLGEFAQATNPLAYPLTSNSPKFKTVATTMTAASQIQTLNAAPVNLSSMPRYPSLHCDTVDI